MGKFDKKLDIASGPLCLARTLQDGSVISFDVNYEALNHGRMQLAQLGALPSVHGTFTHLPFADALLDLEVLSLALLHSVPSEREGIMREMVRTLKRDGVGIITLPTSAGGVEKFLHGLRMLGLQPLEEFTGYATAPKSNYEAFIATVVKVADAPEQLIGEEHFRLPIEGYTHAVSAIRRTRMNHEIDAFKIDGKNLDSADNRQVARAKGLSYEALGELKMQYGGEWENIPAAVLKEHGYEFRTISHKGGEVKQIVRIDDPFSKMKADAAKLVLKLRQRNSATVHAPKQRV